MINIKRIITKYPVSILFLIVIWYLSFFSPPETPLDNVKFIDKWVHIAMYGSTCMVIWLEYYRNHSFPDKVQLAVWAFFMPIIMSGTIELLQEYCTNGRRDGDWLDLCANSIGVTLAAIIGSLLWHFRPKS